MPQTTPFIRLPLYWVLFCAHIAHYNSEWRVAAWAADKPSLSALEAQIIELGKIECPRRDGYLVF